MPMHTTAALALFTVLALAPGHAHPGETSGPAAAGSVDAGARDVAAAFARAWNAHDMQALSALFTDDATWVNIRGVRWSGLDRIRDEHIAIHDRFYGRSRLLFSDVAVHALSEDVAVIHARETIADSDVPPQAGIGPASELSLVVVRRGDRWLIANGHNTNVASMPPR